MSASPASATRASRSTTKARTSGSTLATWRGVNPRDTVLRNSVCTGGSCITSGGLSRRPILSSSSYSVVRPLADENVSTSRAASYTSRWRVSTQ
jgi:hypothetical protein